MGELAVGNFLVFFEEVADFERDHRVREGEQVGLAFFVVVFSCYFRGVSVEEVV